MSAKAVSFFNSPVFPGQAMPISCGRAMPISYGRAREVIRQKAHLLNVSNQVLTILPKIANSDVAQRVGKVCRFIPIISIPFSLYNARNEMRSILVEQRGENRLTRSEKINSGLRFIEYVAATGDSTAALLNGLEKIASIAKGVLIVSAAISGVCTFLWLASIVLQSRQLAKGKEILAQMEKAVSGARNAKSGYKQALENFTKRHVKEIEQSLNVDSGRGVKHTIGKIIQASNRARNPKSSEKMLGMTVEVLSTRIKQKNFSSKLAILSSSINFIALTILMFSPAAPLGLMLLGIAAIITIGKAIKEYREVNAFESRLNNIINFTYQN